MGDFGDQLKTIKEIDGQLQAVNFTLHEQLVLHQAIRENLSGIAPDLDKINDDLKKAYTDAEMRGTSVWKAYTKEYDTTRAHIEGNPISAGVSLGAPAVASQKAEIADNLEDLIKLSEKLSGRYMNMYDNIQRYFGGGMDLDYAEMNEQSRRLTDMTTTIIQDFAHVEIAFKRGGEELKLGLQAVFKDEAEVLEHMEELISQSVNTYAAIRDMDAKAAEDMALLGKAMGLSADQTSTFVQRQISLTGEANLEMLEDAATYAKALEQKFGLNQKQISRRIEEVISSTERFGNVTVEEASRISASLYQTGLDFSELDGMVGKFQGFESAATSVGNLTSVFGINIDAMEMMMLANEDQGKFLMRMRESFTSANISVGDLNLAQKQLIRDQLGLSSVESVERLLGPMGQAVEMIDEMTAATDAPKAKGFAAVSEDILLLSRSTEASAAEMEAALSRAMGAAAVEEIVMFDRAIGELGQTVRHSIGKGAFEGLEKGGKTLKDITGIDVKEQLKGLKTFLEVYVQTITGAVQALAGTSFENLVSKAVINIDRLKEAIGDEGFNVVINVDSALASLDELDESLQGVGDGAPISTAASPETILSKIIRMGLKDSIRQALPTIDQLDGALSSVGVNIKKLTGEQAESLVSRTATQMNYVQGLIEAGNKSIAASDVAHGLNAETVNKILSGDLALAEATAQVFATGAKTYQPGAPGATPGEEGAGGAATGATARASLASQTINLVVDSKTLASYVFNEGNLPEIMDVILKPGAAQGNRTISTTSA